MAIACVAIGVVAFATGSALGIRRELRSRRNREGGRAGRACTRRADFDPKQPPASFDRIFVNGAAFGTGSNRQTTEVRRIGELLVSTGAIVACDPLVFPDEPPFARRVPLGAYPVEVSIARATNGDERIAAARVMFGDDAPVARWELARVDGQSPDTLGDDAWGGYGVDSGTACFTDAATGPLLLAAMDALPADKNYYDTVVAAQMQSVYQPTRSWASHRPDATRGDNVVMFSSGLGDGFYTSWWALDANDAPVALVTDFGVVAGAGGLGETRSDAGEA